MNSKEDFYLGNKLTAYKVMISGIEDIDYDIYPIISRGRTIAFAQATYNDENELVVSCVRSFANELQHCLDNNVEGEFVIVYSKEGVFLVDKSKELYYIYEASNAGLSSIENIDLQRETLNYKKIERKEILNLNYYQSRALQYQALNVPYVYNENVNCNVCNQKGLCWAASMAMIVNYYYGSSYDTSSIHSSTGCMCDATAWQYKAKLQNWVYANGPYFSFSYNTIAGLIQSNYLSFMRLAPTGSNTIGHIVVPYGYYWNEPVSSTKYFYYMDPNYGGGIQSFPSSGSLYVTTSGVTYTFHYYISCYW